MPEKNSEQPLHGMHDRVVLSKPPEPSDDRQWFAVWTRSRQEKSAAAVLSALGVQLYLPLTSQIRQWSDRKQVVTVPLFSGYLFVRINLSRESRLEVLNIAGTAGFVGNHAGPVPIPDQQIQDIQTVLETETACHVVPLLKEGDHVRVLRGPLTGIEGRLIRSNASTRLAISIEMIQKSLIVHVSRHDVELIAPANLGSLLRPSARNLPGMASRPN